MHRDKSKPGSSFTKIVPSSHWYFLEKSTWWGCGSHVPMVMDAIPEQERCACDPKIERDGKQYPPMAKQPF
ncbi:hypothetical protein MY10362_007061 [Beauveria mimosiformis]